MKTEDVIILGRKAKDETEAFINRHLENYTKGWPKIRLCSNTGAEQYHEKYHGKAQKN